MYKQFYGLRDIPFSLAPDPKYLFRTDSLLEVFANLQYGIENGKGIVVVTGEVGTGKTTILRSMLQSLDRSVLAAYIFNPLLSTSEFFDLLAGEFRMRPQQSKAAMLRLLGNVLMARHSQGLRTVLVVDEAHLLPRHLLEEIRLLLNFETNREKLLQVILCGQPQHETAEYIRWRLRIAGCAKEDLFDSEAIQLIHRVSGGIPRIINNICDNALLTGFSEGSPVITPAIIHDVMEELDLSSVDAVQTMTMSEVLVNELQFAAEEQLGSEQAVSARQSPSNVQYIRRDQDAFPRKTTAVAAGNGKYVIRSESETDSKAPLTFFSRVRVSKRS
jgi:general secretion pathway protein A